MSKKLRYSVKFLIVICALSIVNCSFVSAQSRKIDSLRNVLLSAKDDSDKVKTLCALGQELDNASKLAPADSVARMAVALGTKIAYQRGVTKALLLLGTVNDDKGNYTEALNADLEALKQAEASGNKRSIINVTANLALVYFDKGDYPKSLDCDVTVLKIATELGDSLKQAESLGNMGLVYWDREELDKAISYYEQALAIFRHLGDKGRRGVAVNTGNLGAIYYRKHNNAKALEYDTIALNMNMKLGRRVGIINNTINIGGIYLDKDDYNNALDYYNRALKIAEELGDKSRIALCRGDIGEAYMKQKQNTKAEEYLAEAITIASSIGETEMVKSYSKDISDVYADEGKWQKAMEMYRQYSAAKDSLVNTDKNKEIGKLEAKADYDKQLVMQQAEEEKKSVLAAADSKRQKIIIGFVGAIALAVAIIAILIFRSLRITRKQKLLIELQKTEVEKQKILVEEQKGVVEQQKLLVEEKNKEIVDSINYAKRLQDAILPPLSLIKQCLPESFVFYKPKDIVAGDFYWMEVASLPSKGGLKESSSNRNTNLVSIPPSEGGEAVILIAAADCTGHGVPGALVSVVCSNALNSAVKEFHITDPGLILNKVRELVLETFEKSEDNVQDGMDISLAAITASPSASGGCTVQWSGANNPLWVVRKSNTDSGISPLGSGGAIEEIAPDKQPIGKYYNAKPFTTHTIELKKGDTIYLFTDGYADQFGGPKGKKFKYAQFSDKLKAISDKGMEEQKKILDKTFEEWKGKLEQVDDVLIMGIRV